MEFTLKEGTKTELILEDNKITFTDSSKHLKGYMYDSLVYRYIRAREKQAEFEYIYGKTSDRVKCDERANRDIMRFCQILDEAIGEHD